MPLLKSTRRDYTVTTYTTSNDNFKEEIENSLNNTSISGATLKHSTQKENADFFHTLCDSMHFVYTSLIQSQHIKLDC